MQKLYIAGIKNNGTNTCFLNSILQSLASVTSFHYFINHHKDGTHLFHILHNIIKDLSIYQTKEKKPLDILVPTSFGGLQKFQYLIRDAEQQDAHELFIQLVSELDNDVKSIKKRKQRKLPQGGIANLIPTQIPFGFTRVQLMSSKKQSSQSNGTSLMNLLSLPTLRSTTALEPPSNLFPVKSPLLASIENKTQRNPFEGLWARRIKCIKCGYLSPVNYSPFTNLPLPIPPEYHNRRFISLMELFNEFTVPATITGYKCSHCNMLASKKNPEHSVSTTPVISTIKQKTLIGRAPQSLCIHIERSMHQHDVTYKVPCYVRFPEVLDLSNYCVNDLNKDLNPDDAPSPLRPSKTFTLKAVVVHLGGSVDGGHFITYRKLSEMVSNSSEAYQQKLNDHLLSLKKDGVGGQWVRVSDTTITHVNREQVLSENAYMLFYERNF